MCEKRNTHSCPTDPSWAAQLRSHGPECILRGQAADDVCCLGPVHRSLMQMTAHCTGQNPALEEGVTPQPCPPNPTHPRGTLPPV